MLAQTKVNLNLVMLISIVNDLALHSKDREKTYNIKNTSKSDSEDNKLLHVYRLRVSLINLVPCNGFIPTSSLKTTGYLDKPCLSGSKLVQLCFHNVCRVC